MPSKPLQRIADDGASIAAILIAIALILVLGSNLRDLLRSQGELQTSIAQQETAMRTNAKIETQLDKLANGTQGLADQGNPNARRIIALLNQNGIVINKKK